MGFFDKLSGMFSGKAAERVTSDLEKGEIKTKQQIAQERMEAAKRKIAEKREKAKVAKEAVLERAREAKKAAQERWENAKKKTQESIAKAGDKARKAGNFIVVTGLTLPETVSDAKTNLLIWGGEAAGKIGKKEDAIYEGAAKKWEDVNKTAGEIRQSAAEAIERFGNKVDETIENGKNRINELADRAREKRDKLIEAIKDKRFADGVKKIEATSKKEKAEVTDKYWDLISKNEKFIAGKDASNTFFELTNALHGKLDDVDLNALKSICELQEKIYGSKEKAEERASQEMPL